uniref:Uncharacterized protein n=1 Tax=Rhizophora mucronata TaxID=61149 RepID=A0A2P2PZC4_RHIMU
MKSKASYMLHSLLMCNKSI